jgi:hypothetical protein
MWAADFEVFREWFWVRVVSLSKFMHPSVVENSAFIILRKRMTMLVLTTEISKCCFVINDVTGFSQITAFDTVDEWANDQTRQEIRRR